MMISGCGAAARNWKSGGMMPTTCDDAPSDNVPLPPAESIESARPITVSSPPKRRCQNACDRMTGAGPSAAGPYSAAVNQRPRTGCTPSACSVPSETRRARTRSASPRSVSVAESSCHRPIATNDRFSCPYVVSMFVLAKTSAVLSPAEGCLIRTSSSAFGYGKGLISTE